MEKLLFIISKGFEKSGGAKRAMQLAAIASGKGHSVEIFLIDDAIHWAQLPDKVCSRHSREGGNPGCAHRSWEALKVKYRVEHQGLKMSVPQDGFFL